jgi:hypothetical protein
MPTGLQTSHPPLRYGNPVVYHREEVTPSTAYDWTDGSLPDCCFSLNVAITGSVSGWIRPLDASRNF